MQDFCTESVIEDILERNTVELREGKMNYDANYEGGGGEEGGRGEEDDKGGYNHWRGDQLWKWSAE